MRSGASTGSARTDSASKPNSDQPSEPVEGSAQRDPTKPLTLLLAIACLHCIGMGGEMGIAPEVDAGGRSVDDAGQTVTPAPDAGTPATPVDAGQVTQFDAGSSTSIVDAGTSAPAADLEVHFPPPGSATTETHLLVHGSTRAGLSVTSVRVHGLEATSTDQFRTWRIDVPLSSGTNVLAVDLTSGGVTHTAFTTVTVERFADDATLARGTGTWAGRILGLAWDAIGRRVILADDVEDGVWGVSDSSGNRAIISDSEGDKVGAGYDIVQPRSGVVIGNTSYIIDDTLIVGIDLTSGDRTIVATAPDSLNDMALAPNGTELIAGSLNLKSILAINPKTGGSRVVSSATVGTGTGPGNVGPLGLSSTQHTAYLGLRYQDTLLAVDLTTGNRRVFSEAASGEPKFNDPEFITVDDFTGQAFVWDTARLVAVDLSTGRRTLVTVGSMGWATGVHAMTTTPFGVALIDYVPSWEPPPHRDPTLFVVDPLSGGRVALSR